MAWENIDAERDVTVVVFDSPVQKDKEAEPAFTPVAVAPGRQAPPGAPWLAQQTSFDTYSPGLNPVISSASRLLVEIVRIRGAREVDLEGLRSRLEAEVRGFRSQAAALGINEAQVNAAQYLLCTALDESVTTSAIAEAQGEWQRDSLLSTFHKDTWGGEVFFEVLTRLMEQPASRLYLLELAYLLLSLGFEGKYRLHEKGVLQVESLRDQLYRQILLLRGEPGPDLSKKPVESSLRQKIYSYAPPWLIAAAVVFCLSVTWWGFSFTLSSKAEPLLTRYEALAPVGRPYARPAPEAAPENAGPAQAEAAPAAAPPGQAAPEAQAAPPAPDAAPAAPADPSSAPAEGRSAPPSPAPVVKAGSFLEARP
jgi:type VI secretion system protein ImpK